MTRVQRKLVAVFILTEALVAGVFGLILVKELGREYYGVEEHMALDLLRQVEGAFNVELVGLRNSVTDWGRWDSLLGFLRTRDPVFLEENIPENVVDNLDLDYLLIVDLSGNPVVWRAKAAGAEAMEDALSLVRPGAPLAATSGTEEAKSGLALVRGEPVLVATHAVTSGDGTAPPGGMLLMARRVSESVLRRVRESSTLSLRLFADPGPELGWILDRTKPGDRGVFRAVSWDRAEVGMPWPDVTGDHRVAVVATVDRPLHRQYLKTVSRLWLGLAVTSLSALLVFMAYLKWNLVNRVLRLGREIAALNPREAELSLVTRDGRDEITTLQQSVNDLLRGVSESRQALAREQRIFNAVVSSARDAIFLMGDDGRVIFANAAVEGILGWKPEELVGQDLHALLAPERYREQAREGLAQFRESGEGVAIDNTLELTARRRDGSEVPVEVSLSALRLDDRWHAVGIVRDITARKRTETLARQSEEMARAIMENIHYGVLLINRDFRVIMSNAAARQYAIHDDTDTCYRMYNTESPEGPCATCAVQRCFEDGRVHEARRAVTYPDGTARVFRLRAFPVRDDQGEHGNLVIEFFEDITEMERQEQESRQHQRLEVVGRLAAGIAHEINTPIQYVGDNLEFLGEAIGVFRERIEGGGSGGGVSDDDVSFYLEESPKAISQAREGVARVAGIVRAMKAFSHPGSGEKTLGNLNQDLLNTITVSRNEWKYVADLKTELDDNLPPVPCYPGELNQVYLNLIVNAAHAIGDKVDREKGEKGLITVATRLDGDWVEIRISDTGTGIPESVRERVFDPFFTTKEVGKGTGQGLAIARDVIVNKHGGTITFETEEGKGTTFIIRLPLKEGEASRGVVEQQEG
ncbi:MAG TPA: PAS domain S-box protein [Candidatus Hydrogenedentes bacterium]|nr:PAS domain S-box protein [Candidatus Hydrogenedentota bacterium]